MADFYVAHEYWFAVVQLVLAMLGMGATLTFRNFREVLLEPRAVTIGILVQLVATPLIAYGCIHTFGVAGGVAVGIALISAVPGGTTSNVFTFFARGNTALSITITAITTLACMVTTPIILALLISDAMPANFRMPTGRIAFEISISLLLPLLIGMLYLIAFPASAPSLSKWCIRGSLLGILAIAIGALAAGRLDLQAFGLTNILLLTGFITLLAMAGWLVTRAAGLPRADGKAISMELIVRNVNLGILIKASLFPAAEGATRSVADLVLFALLFYGGLQLAAGAGLIYRWRRREIA